MFERIDTVCLQVKDLAAAKSWYTEKLNLREIYADDSSRLVVFEIGGPTSLTIWELKPGEAAPTQTGGTFPILLTKDAAKTHSELKRRGVKVGDIDEGPDVRFFDFFDADGNHLGACELINS
jgi:catechol 2,3-dioxygenase-like lactoylglutathione lyase family enzyme